jgi:hypothetical protein
MATSLASLASITLNATLTNTSGVIGSATDALTKAYGSALTNGTGAGNADLVYWGQRTLVASAAEDLDLAGVLLDPLGNTLTFVRIKALVIAAASGNTNNVVVGNAAANGVAGLFGALTHTAIVRPGAAICWVCGSADATGYVVTATTADLLHIANSAGSSPVTYDVGILGCSA